MRKRVLAAAGAITVAALLGSFVSAGRSSEMQTDQVLIQQWVPLGDLGDVRPGSVFGFSGEACPHWDGWDPVLAVDGETTLFVPVGLLTDKDGSPHTDDHVPYTTNYSVFRACMKR